LEIKVSNTPTLKTSGNLIPGNPEENLILKAYELLKKDFRSLPTVSIHLHKAIPIGAGLGGGTADAAFAMTLTNKLFELYLDDWILDEYAYKLGSDCPFFIQNQPKLVGGRGEVMEPVQLDLSGTWIYLINPNIHISTKEAYAGVKPKAPDSVLAQLLPQKENWKMHLTNDFEEGIFSRYPEIAGLKEVLYDSGAYYASMSGSGSSVFGLFPHVPKKITLPDHYFQFCRQI
jgi:4-diphosphocytidyl-2-C-methyl-D-erythritol kinase